MHGATAGEGEALEGHGHGGAMAEDAPHAVAESHWCFFFLGGGVYQMKAIIMYIYIFLNIHRYTLIWGICCSLNHSGR